MVSPFVTIKYEKDKTVICIFGRNFEFFNSFKLENDHVSKTSGFKNFEYAPLIREEKEWPFRRFIKRLDKQGDERVFNSNFFNNRFHNSLFSRLVSGICDVFKKTSIYIHNKFNINTYVSPTSVEHLKVSFLHHIQNVLKYKREYLPFGIMPDVKGIIYFFIVRNWFDRLIRDYIKSWFINDNLFKFILSLNHFILNRFFYYVLNALIYTGFFDWPRLGWFTFHVVSSIRGFIDLYLHVVSFFTVRVHNHFYELRDIIYSSNCFEFVISTWIICRQFGLPGVITTLFLFICGLIIHVLYKSLDFYLNFWGIVWYCIFCLNFYLCWLESLDYYTLLNMVQCLYSFSLFILIIVLIILSFIFNLSYKIMYMYIDLNIWLFLFALNEYVFVYNSIVPKSWNIHISLNIPVYNSIFMYYYSLRDFTHISYYNLITLTHSYARTPYGLEWLRDIQYSSFSYHPACILHNFELGNTSVFHHLFNPQPKFNYIPLNTNINTRLVIDQPLTLLESADVNTNNVLNNTSKTGWYLLIGVASVVVVCVVVDCICNA